MYRFGHRSSGTYMYMYGMYFLETAEYSGHIAPWWQWPHCTMVTVAWWLNSYPGDSGWPWSFWYHVVTLRVFLYWDTYIPHMFGMHFCSAVISYLLPYIEMVSKCQLCILCLEGIRICNQEAAVQWPSFLPLHRCVHILHMVKHRLRTQADKVLHTCNQDAAVQCESCALREAASFLLPHQLFYTQHTVAEYWLHKLIKCPRFDSWWLPAFSLSVCNENCYKLWFL